MTCERAADSKRPFAAGWHSRRFGLQAADQATSPTATSACAQFLCEYQKRWVLTALPCALKINDLAVSQTMGKTPEVLTRFSPVSVLHPKGVEAPCHERRGSLHATRLS